MTVSLVPLEQLTPAPWNPRHIDKARLNNLAASIKHDPNFLLRRPILAQLSGEIYAVCGNGFSNAVWEWFLERGTIRTGQIVFDPFCGSGTTIVAAERLNRRARAIEISPAYCDVAIRRWERVSGRQAYKKNA
jgi:hypothetical protein